MSQKKPNFPTVAEVLEHPAFPTAVFNLKPTRQGRTSVGAGRGGPFQLAWQIHGSGPIRIVLVSGLGSQRSLWQRQTLYFGHEHGDKYSLLLFDNRGIGDSEMPVMRYTTSDMAYDMAEILVDVGWIDPEALRPPPSVATPAKFDDPDFEVAATAGTEAAGIAQRRLHIIGISLGGMIAQELGMLIPHAISTLNLCCTAAEVKNTTTFTENMLQRLSLVVPQGLEESVRATALRMFPVDWLMAPDDVHLPDLGREDVPGVGPPSPGPGVLPAWKQGIVPSIDGPKQTGHQDREQDAVPREYRHFPTNYHRYVAQDMAKRLDPARFPAAGFLLQMIAAGWHRKTATELRLLGDMVGRERILVMHGTGDGMLTVPHGETLIALLQPGVGLIVDGMGHGPVVERWKWFNALMADRFAVGERLDGRSEAS